MENIKVKEIKDDAVINIKVNKTFYMMCKSALLIIFKEVHTSKQSTEKFMESILKTPYPELGEKERIFHTLTMLIGEIEKQAKENDLIIDKEIDVEALKKEADEIEKSNED